MLAKEVMHSPVVTIHAQATLRQAVQQMLEHDVNGLPVVDAQQHVIGIIGLQDILRGSMPSPARAKILRGSQEEYIARELDAMRVEGVMAKHARTIKEDDPLMKAVAMIESEGFEIVPVLRDGQLVGVISRADAVRALSEYRLAPIVP